MIPRVNVAVNAAFIVFFLWLYIGDLVDAVHVNTFEVSAMTSLRSPPFAVAMLVLGFIGGGLTVFGVVKRRDGTWRGYRIMPIIAVVGLAVDLFVLSDHNHFSTPQRAVAVREVIERSLNELSTTGGVVTDSATLEKLLDDLGEPPWMVKGQPVPKWALRISSDCTGPQLDPKGAGAGTMLYCVAADRSEAWVTFVGLPLDQQFGAPQVVSSGGQPLVSVVQRRGAEAPPEGQEPPPEQDPAPMDFDRDAGNVPLLP